MSSVEILPSMHIKIAKFCKIIQQTFKEIFRQDKHLMALGMGFSKRLTKR